MSVATPARLWPAAMLVTVAAVVICTRADFAIADAVYAWEGGAWSLRHDFFVSTIMHARAQKVLIAVHAIVALLALASMLNTPLKRWRTVLAYVALASLTSIALVALGKYLLPMPCPSHLERYGGTLPAQLWLNREFVGLGHGCFPSAHATCGFALLPWYFVARAYALPAAWCMALPALVVGGVFGVVQQIRGATFCRTTSLRSLCVGRRHGLPHACYSTGEEHMRRADIRDNEIQDEFNELGRKDPQDPAIHAVLRASARKRRIDLQVGGDRCLESVAFGKAYLGDMTIS